MNWDSLYKCFGKESYEPFLKREREREREVEITVLLLLPTLDDLQFPRLDDPFKAPYAVLVSHVFKYGLLDLI